MSPGPVYDEIGRGYTSTRRPDPRWHERIHAEVGPGSLLNVGAGAGSYEPSARRVVALEPSETMIRQRPPGAAPVVRGVAGSLPFADGAFDVAMAVLTIHHWADAAAGLEEMRRVASRQVVVTWDPEVAARFWLLRDYLPEVLAHDAGLATLAQVEAGLPGCQVVPLMVPADCVDGFLGAYWKRPHAYLDPVARGAISGLALLAPEVVDAAMARLADDLESGRWAARAALPAETTEADLGYRLVVAGPAAAP